VEREGTFAGSSTRYSHSEGDVELDVGSLAHVRLNLAIIDIF